ncbi:YlxM family DNA-binding protein [Negativicoccus succinicivorans]|uniref:YlxM family DNA-binding protein n=1 Tax=Negativicoccus succinicivorans TaxID=620903 RepID=UPI0028FF9A75|nr:sigma factor-like helix-turn-helix DNA-binding protein [Negativicoccus succinicivorans]MDU2418232.1 sigma factor-like helix-turn-helix DNA-binding protein [Negativicoccus succinicivorans]
MELKKLVWHGELLATYGALLAERPRQCMELYYNDDYTLAEIADRLGVSRQAVHDNLQRALRDLEQYEAALKLVEDQKQRREVMARMERDLSPAFLQKWQTEWKILSGKESTWHLKV